MGIFSKGKNDSLAGTKAVHADNVPFASEEEERDYGKLLGDRYVIQKQLDMTREELEVLSLTDCAELWRLFSWYRKETAIKHSADKTNLYRQRQEALTNILSKKILQAETLYCVYNKYTGEPHIFSRTVRQDNGYLCTAPNIRLFTPACAERAARDYTDMVYDMKRIDRGINGKGIETLLAEAFYQNGAQNAEINSEHTYVPAAKLISPPDYSGKNEENIPVLNPDLMRWALLMAQMPEPATTDEKLKYFLYYRFLSIEMTKAKFLVPVNSDDREAPRQRREENTLIKLRSGGKSELATIKGRYDREALVMYTDWKHLRQRYSGWGGSVMTAADAIGLFDLAINSTDYPKLGFYVTKEIYADMVNQAVKDNEDKEKLKENKDKT